MREAYADIALRAARAGASVLEGWFRRADLEVRRKGQNDFVTRADHESEAAVVAVLRDLVPEDTVLTEEAGWLPGRNDSVQWIIDPLDGTTNFLQGLPVWCVSVGCVRNGEPIAGAVVDPLGGNWFVGERGAGVRWNDRPAQVSSRGGLSGAFLATGYPFRAHAALDHYLDAFREVFRQARAIRRCGAAALDLAYTAVGVYDGFFEFRLSPWDVAAGGLLVLEAGGQVSDLDGGGRWLRDGNVLAGGPAVHAELQRAVARHASEAELDRLVPPLR
jgi:myo-inositol-1(or 4)-monophosphatase